MNKSVPDPETFVNGVEQYGYSTENLYFEAVERFRREILQPRSFNPEKIEEIVWETFLKRWGKMQRNVPKTNELTTGINYAVSQCENVDLLHCKLREANLHDVEDLKAK